MNRLAVFWQSSVGKKAVMAVTGLILVAYLITHVLANLLVFRVPSASTATPQLLHSTRRGALGRAAGPARRARPPHHRGDPARDPEPRGPAGSATRAGATRRCRPSPRARSAGAERSSSVPGLPHPPLHDRHGAPGFRRAEPAPQRQHRLPQPPGGSCCTWSRCWRSASTSTTDVEQRPEPGSQPAVAAAAPPAGRPGSGGLRLARLHRDRDRGVPRADPRRMSMRPAHGTEPQDPVGTDRGEVGQAPLRDEAGEPRQQAEIHRHRGRQRARRRVRRRDAQRAGLQREVLLLPGLAPARAQHRGPGRHQRRQELPERRRQHLPAVLRHGEGRRLPRARGERLPAGPDQRQHHRPVRGAGRAVRARVRRAAREPVVRRGPGLAHLLRARPDRAAAAARRVPGAREGRSRAAGCTMFPRTEMLDLVVVDGRARGIVVRDIGHRARSSRTSATRWCWPPAATATSSTSRPTPRAATPPPSGAPTSGARASPIPASPRSTRPASP